MKIEVWSDYNCPFCYIGEVTLRNALEELDLSDKIEIIHRAYQLDPNAPKVSTQTTAEALSTKYNVSKHEAKNMMQKVVDRAALIGLRYDYDIVKPTNTYDAHRLAKMATESNHLNELTMALFNAYFTDGVNLADADSLVDLAVACGLNSIKVHEMLNSNDYTSSVNADIAEAKTLGIRGVPFFMIDRKIVINGAQPLETFVSTIKKAYAKQQ